MYIFFYRSSSFNVKFWNELYKHLIYSPARNPDLFFIESNLSDTSDLISSTTVLSLNRPVMLYLVHKLTTSYTPDGKLYSRTLFNISIFTIVPVLTFVYQLYLCMQIVL